MNARAWIVAALAFGLCAATRGEDWPQWRGPRRDGISQETGLLKEWPEEGPKLLWQVHDIGDGYSTPAVVGERLYLMSNRGMDNEFVAGAGRQGRQPGLDHARSARSAPTSGQKYPGARSTPTVDGERLYALGSDGDLACLETATGKHALAEEPAQRFRRQARQLGLCRVAAGRWRRARLHARRQRGHARRARTSRPARSIWTSAVPEGDEAALRFGRSSCEAAGVKQYVQFLQKGLVGVDAKTGKFLWRYDKTAEGSPANIPTPVVHDDYVYSATGRGGGGLVQLKADGEPGHGRGGLLSSEACPRHRRRGAARRATSTARRARR